MDLVNKSFENLVHHTYLTENVSLLLYSLIRMYRPLTALEIGAGYSTLCIAKAFDDIQKEKLSLPKESHLFNNWFVGNSSHSGIAYNPKLITVDCTQFDGMNARIKSINQKNEFNKIIQLLEEMDLKKFVDIRVALASSIFLNVNNDDTMYDFVWIDAGDGREFPEVFDLLYPKLNPGAIIAFHNVVTTVTGKAFLFEMALRMKTSNDFEMLTLNEPHKKDQNSIALFKKNVRYPSHHLTS
jgi:predicted O-methyltransferase YrrM